MDSEVEKFINERISLLERQYNLIVLLWSLRGSIDIGIYRNNSDLDILFLFKNKGNNKCSAIHDIIRHGVGHGIELWGWNIYDALETVCQNTKMFYRNVKAPISNISLSKEHARGSLTYYFGLFCALGNKNIGGNKFFLSKMDPLLRQIVEKRILMNHILEGVNNKVEKIYATGLLSENEYLYTVWRILLAKHVYNQGLPGESNMAILINKYGEGIKSDVLNLITKYRYSMAKHAQQYEIPSINSFICNEYSYIAEIAFKLTPEKDECFDDGILKLKILSDNSLTV